MAVSFQRNLKKVRTMSDEDLLTVWRGIWATEPDLRPSDTWSELVYSELSRRGISGF